MLISIETHITCDFPGGGPDHPSGSAHCMTSSEGGRERERCGLFLKGKTLFLQSVI